MRINLGKEKGAKEQGEEDTRGQLSRHTVSHGVTVKVRYTEVSKVKSPKAKGTWYNLIKGKLTRNKACYSPAFISNNKSLCVIYLGAEWQAPPKRPKE